MKHKRVALLGSTGSIGKQALDVISANPHLRVCALAAGGNAALLAEQARRFEPEYVAIADESRQAELRDELPKQTRLLAGHNAMTELVRLARADVVLSGVVGSAGLEPTLAAIECGSTLAIANKETLVVGGAIVMPAARKAGVAIMPVDSEHSAIFQCLQGHRREEVARVVITASGGALRDWTEDNASNACVEDALNHPTWAMGRKITIDSATMMNKALEIIEAHWLFDLPAERIGVVQHPQSIVHSYVEFHDGSVIAQMGMPDMTTPIAYALSWPQRFNRSIAPLDLATVGSLTFQRPQARFQRAVNLGFEVIRRGAHAGAVLNGANDEAVQAFINGSIRLGGIVELVEDILCKSPWGESVTLESLAAAEEWAKEQVRQTLGESSGLSAKPNPELRI
ncbi:MAG: 1-deoxy-D-xylulose-5-phosphate reductoisomerase [Planctomycetes bacterium]|nr:1-deoxy-D-xylulose-5-phosphate reductoisomerase [Planctomycetota bacterium]